MKRSVFILFFFIITSCSGDLKPIEYNNPFDTSGTNPPVSVNVGTHAGTGAPGSVDGGGGAASFYFPFGLAIDNDRNIFVADTYNHKIRKISPDVIPLVTTYAGSGTAGSADGTGTGASFNYPFSVAVDASGNLYVADKGNNKIRKIAPGGTVTTFAGSGSPGDVNGTGSAASFNSIMGVAVDSLGNVYVADEGNNKIKKITPAGEVTSLTTISFDKPKGVAVDSSGTVYVSDESHVIRKVTPSGLVTVLAGSGAPGGSDGYRTSASFNFPWGLTVDPSGNLFVADQLNHVIRKITPEGFVLTYAGFSGVAGYGDGVSSTLPGVISTAYFNLPTGVACHAGSGDVHVADMNNHRIRVIFK